MQSMSRRGNCLDNSPMERVFRSLKSEWLLVGVSLDIENYCTLRLNFDHFDTREPLPERLLVF
ncbi:transposase remnant [Yersinia pseudotuberculosis]|nr:transposase remnant [Yersinia pseudotuberculosis]